MSEENETQPSRGQPAIDAKDIVLHLRTIHFSLLAACVGLYVLLTAGRSEEIDLARSQLAEIVALVDRWQPEWVESAALDLRSQPPALDTPVARGAGPMRLDIDLGWTLLPLPRELLELAYPGAAPDPFDHNGPLWSRLARPKPRDRQLSPLQRTEFTPNVAPLRLPAPRTLKEFETVWNALGRITLTLTEAQWIFPQIMASAVGAPGTWPYAELPPADGIRLSMRLEPIDDSQQEAEWRDRVEHEWAPGYHFVGHIDMAADGVADLLPNPPPAQGDETLSDLASLGVQPAPEPATISMATQIETREIDAQTAFIGHFGLTWRTGSFALNSPELSAVAAGNDDLYFERVTAFIESKARQSEGEFAIFGFRVPVAKVASWGVPIMLVVQIYFLLHLRSLRQCLSTSTDPKLAPWIGVYSDQFARTIAAASASLLPPATLGAVIAQEVAARPVLIIGVVASGLLGLAVFWIMRQVWKLLGDE